MKNHNEKKIVSITYDEWRLIRPLSAAPPLPNLFLFIRARSVHSPSDEHRIQNNAQTPYVGRSSGIFRVTSQYLRTDVRRTRSFILQLVRVYIF